MFATELTQTGHVKRFSIRLAGTEGWEIRVEQDSDVVRRERYTDWHRVERALTDITEEVSSLKAGGWSETSRSGR
jgi:hypothetical protein